MIGQVCWSRRDEIYSADVTFSHSGSNDGHLCRVTSPDPDKIGLSILGRRLRRLGMR